MDLSILGLTKYEIQAYQAIITHGKAPASAISQASHVPYGRIYDVLAALERKGLIRVLPEPTKHYAPADPRQLKELLEEKQKQLQDVEEQLHHLEQLYDQHEVEPVLIARGKRNFHRLVKESPSSETFAYSIKYTADFNPKWVQNTKKNMKRGIQFKVLTNYNQQTKEAVDKWMKIQPNHRKIENDGVAIGINDGHVMLGLIKSNTTLIIRDKPFIKLMKQLVETQYEHAEKIK